MSFKHVAPLLLSGLTGLLLLLVSWGFLRVRHQEASDTVMRRHDDMLLLGMLALAAFAFGVFLTYVLLIFHFQG